MGGGFSYVFAMFGWRGTGAPRLVADRFVRFSDEPILLTNTQIIVLSEKSISLEWRIFFCLLMDAIEVRYRRCRRFFRFVRLMTNKKPHGAAVTPANYASLTSGSCVEIALE